MGKRYRVTFECYEQESSNDNQDLIISDTIVAALGQGLTDKTHVTALWDGAANCWSVVEAIKPLCAHMTYVLDWFHIEQLISLSKKDEKYMNKIKKFYNYIENNKDKIVNYRERQKSGLVFTSNLAESTVEILINHRCKGQQRLRWSREVLNPLLQLRTAIQSNDWEYNWQTAILNAA